MGGTMLGSPLRAPFFGIAAGAEAAVSAVGRFDGRRVGAGGAAGAGAGGTAAGGGAGAAAEPRAELGDVNEDRCLGWEIQERRVSSGDSARRPWCAVIAGPRNPKVGRGTIAAGRYQRLKAGRLAGPERETGAPYCTLGGITVQPREVSRLAAQSIAIASNWNRYLS